MSRRIRPHCPGTPFHLTARIQGHEPLFQGLEARIAALILETAIRSDVRLLAYAVMPNHLHVMLVQGQKELRVYMQPLLRCIALIVLRHHKREGHVFERRYNACACRDPEYFRNALVYVHLNPARAGLCCDPAEYPWTSHTSYMNAQDAITWPVRLAFQPALRMFCRAGSVRASDWCADYAAYVSWRQQMDRFAEDPDKRATTEQLKPRTGDGDRYWYEEFGAVVGDDPSIRSKRLDLRDIAKNALGQIAPDMTLDLLRSGGRTRALVAVRRQVISRALLAGYRAGQIAQFLNVSSTTITLATRPR